MTVANALVLNGSSTALLADGLAGQDGIRTHTAEQAVAGGGGGAGGSVYVSARECTHSRCSPLCESLLLPL